VPTKPTVFHRDLSRLARMLPRKVITATNLGLLQRMTAMTARRAPSGVELLTLTSGVRVWLYRPSGVSTPAPALLWMHGGGYLIGSAAQDDSLCRRFAATLGATVVSVEYRLAPQHPYPAALEDCYAALTWLAGLPAVDPQRVAIGGASAGGGLAAALALLVRDRAEISLAAQLLVYPMLDDRTVGTEFDDPDYRLWSQENNRLAWSMYLAGADPEVAVPARQQDLSGLPATWMGVGTLDLFHDEDLRYAQRLHDAGVPCDIEVVEGAFHGFDGLAPKTGVTRSFFESQCATLRRAFSPAPIPSPADIALAGDGS
jgi:acetyl esterase/lipase